MSAHARPCRSLIGGLEITVLSILNVPSLYCFGDTLVFLGQLKGKSDRRNENITPPFLSFNLEAVNAK